MILPLAAFTPSITAPLRVVCAWCHQTMVDGPEHPVSHGICTQCEHHLFPEAS